MLVVAPVCWECYENNKIVLATNKWKNPWGSFFDSCDEHAIFHDQGYTIVYEYKLEDCVSVLSVGDGNELFVIEER